MTTKNKKRRRNSGGGEGQTVGIFYPKDGIKPADYMRGVRTSAEENRAFQKDFLDTLKHRGEGLMIRYLFHEPQEENILAREEKGFAIYDALENHFGRILYGGYAWDEYIRHSKSYGITNSDLQALDFSISKKIETHLPKNLHIVEYGPGGLSGVVKSQKLIEALLNGGNHNLMYTAVDILSRFAIDSAKSIHDKFYLPANAVVCDFMSAAKVNLPTKKSYTPLAVIFGGTLANAPDYSASGGKNSRSNFVTYLQRMNVQHGLGSYVLMTYHSENNSRILQKEYQATDELSAFVLGGFTRAVRDGVITDPSYDPFQHWNIKPHYDSAAKALKMYAVSRTDHTVPTIDGDVDVKRGECVANTLSYKWSRSEYRPIFQKAGYEIVEIYRKEGSPRGLILARAVRPPRP